MTEDVVLLSMQTNIFIFEAIMLVHIDSWRLHEVGPIVKIVSRNTVVYEIVSQWKCLFTQL